MFCTWKGVFRTKYLGNICQSTAFNAYDMAQVAWHFDKSAFKKILRPKKIDFGMWQLKYAPDWRKQYHSNKIIAKWHFCWHFVFFCIHFDYIYFIITKDGFVLIYFAIINNVKKFAVEWCYLCCLCHFWFSDRKKNALQYRKSKE